MSAAVVVIAEFTPKAGAFDQLVDVLSDAIADVHGEDGCLLYAIHRHPDGRIIMIEKWTSAELLDVHGSSSAVQRLNAQAGQLLAGPIVVTRLAPIPAGTPTQGLL